MTYFKTFLLSAFLCLLSMNVNAEILYTVQDLGTLATDKSEARSLNANGWVAGKYFNKDETADFLWTPETGLEIITNEADKESYPKLNNAGIVRGFMLKPGGWLSSAQMRRYVYNLSHEFAYSDWSNRDKGWSVIAMNDLYTLMCDHVDPFKSSICFFDGNGKFVTFGKFFHDGSDQRFATAMNNHSQIVVTTEIAGFLGTSFLSTYELNIYDVETSQWAAVAYGALYYAVGINDQQMIIARNKKGNEGFFGSKELGMSSLKDFVPTALNNLNQIVGKKKQEVFLRQPDSTMISLNQAVDLKQFGIEKITDAWSINDQGQILVTARIAGKSHTLLLQPH